MSRSVGVLGIFNSFHRIGTVKYSKRCLSTSYTKFRPRGLRIERHSISTEDNNQETLGQSVDLNHSESEKFKCKTADPVVLKYTNFINSLRNGKVQEKVYDTQFGNIRFDTENIPVVHGQFDNIGNEILEKEMEELDKMKLVNQNIENVNDGIGKDMNYFDQSWFEESYENYKGISNTEEVIESFDNSKGVQSDLNFVDEGIFGETYSKTLKNEDKSLQTLKSSTIIIDENHAEVIDTNDLGSIDQAYFNESFDRINENKKPFIEFHTIMTDFEKSILDIDEENDTKAEKLSSKEYLQSSGSLDYADKDLNNEVSPSSLNMNKFKEFYLNPSSVSDVGNLERKTDFEKAIIENRNEKDKEFSNFRTDIEVQSDTTLLDNNSLSKMEGINQNELLAKTEFSKTKLMHNQRNEIIENNSMKNETAYDYVLNMRKYLEQGESKNVVSNDIALMNFDQIIKEVQNLDEKSHYDVLKLLKKSILYDNYDIVGLYKPYGMGIHPGTTGSKHVLTDYLEDLAKALKVPKLYTLHRLDAQTTGVLLLAKTPEMADKLKGMFKNKHLTKTYLAITKGIPGKLQGILDIPIAEGMIDGRRRMALRPNVKGLKHSWAKSKLAITKYKVLSSVNSASLIEVVPVTGVKHQIRVHLGFGLGTPVLGDHKYSHLKKLAPQRLSGDILEHLQMPQSKVRKLPRFLHAKSIFIPEIIDGRNISIQAALPSYFTKAISMLELQKRRNKNEEKTQNTITIL